MEVTQPRGVGIAPGEKLPLVLTFTTADGKTFVTEGAGHGKVLWKDLTLATTVVVANQKGILSLPEDPRLSEGKVAHVAVSVPTHPDLHTEFDIPPRYDYTFVADFSGSRGASGSSGSNGMDGASGSSGSTDPNNPSPGGNGSNGSNGSDGGDGGPGGDAPPLHVRVTLRPGDHPLLQVAVSAVGGRSAARREKLYLVDPNGGSLTVKADGGPGGSGGSGGRGGRGGAGGSGSPSGSNGTDGASGRSGWDGAPGKAGSISVTYDPQVKPFLGSILLSNKGGPVPAFTEEAVAPLW